MICYKDKTFCTFYRECKDGKTCDRSLTEDVQYQAKLWWKSNNPPICQFQNKPDCFVQSIN